MGKAKFPHPEISPGITAKFQLCSILATESHTTIPLLVPLASGLERKWVDPGNLCVSMFSTELVEITVECLSARCECRDQCVSSAVNCTSRPLSVTAVEMAREGEHLPWCFHLYFTTHLQKCVVSDYEKVTVNYICTNSQTPGMPWHDTSFLDCTIDHSLGLNIRNTWWALRRSTWPPPGDHFHWNLWKGAQTSIFFKVSQMLPAIQFCKPLYVPRFHPGSGAKRWESRSRTVSKGETYTGQVADSAGHAWF